MISYEEFKENYCNETDFIYRPEYPLDIICLRNVKKKHKLLILFDNNEELQTVYAQDYIMLPTYYCGHATDTLEEEMFSLFYNLYKKEYEKDPRELVPLCVFSNNIGAEYHIKDFCFGIVEV